MTSPTPENLIDPCEAGTVSTSTVGQRIAAYRRRRGLSQAAVAGLIGRSESWLSQVERGIRSVDRLSVLLDLARVLQVDVQSLTGSTWQLAPNGKTTSTNLDQLRRAFTSYEAAIGSSDEVTSTVSDTRKAIANLHSRYQAADYTTVLNDLGPLLTQVERLHAAQPSAPEIEPSLLYVEAYVLAAKLVTKLGDGELAILAADRSATVATQTGSSVATALAMYQVCCALLRSDRLDDAERLAIAMAERNEPDLRSDQPALVSAVGALWLLSAVIAARRTDRFLAEERLKHASGLADLLGHDANFGFTAFGPTNVAIHRVSVAAELGDVGGALREAAFVNPDHLPTTLASRRAQVNLDLAWANSQRRHDADATLQLLEAERTAPEAVRYNVIVQEMVREMLRRAGRTHSSALSELARRNGLLH